SSLATDTPSLVMRGAPKLLSLTTLRPFGPSVTFTASARMSTPLRMRSRASRPNFTSLAAMWLPFQFLVEWKFSRTGVALANDPEDVRFLHDQQIFAVDLDLGARPLAEQDAVASLDVERNAIAVFVTGAFADGDDFAFLRLFLGGVGDDDAASGLGFGLDAANEHAVVQRTKVHGALLN